MKFIIVLFILLIILGIGEKKRHEINRRKIRTCIYVNGTRGKSSTTRLIAAGLRQAGMRTMARTTGTAARLIYPDGTEKPLQRRGVPRIIEQVRLINKASSAGVDILILECMAVSPEMQWVSEQELMKSDLGIITNVRADHEENMGETLSEIAETLALTTPRQGILITAEQNFFTFFSRKASRFNSEIIKVDASLVTAKELQEFTYPAHSENISLALKTCEQINIDRNTALTGMKNCQPDPGALFLKKIKWQKNTYYFINAFAANDLLSTRMAWEKWQEWYSADFLQDMKVVGLFNNRYDRLFRLRKMAKFCLEIPRLERIYLLGDGKFLARRILREMGFCNKQVEYFRETKAERLLKKLDSFFQEDVLIFGFGNTAGAGEGIIRLFLERGEDIV